MSDVSQGPGWWMATDHKWYPPESHPGYQPPPPNFAAANPYPGGQTFYPNLSSHYPAGPALADYGSRLGGWLIDWLILLVVCGVISASPTRFITAISPRAPTDSLRTIAALGGACRELFSHR